MDDDTQELDTTHMSTEKQPALTSTEEAPCGLLLGACQVLATQLEKDILAEEIKVAALKRLLHLQKVRAECETLCWELELLGVMEADTITNIANAQATQGDTKQDVPRPTLYEGKNQCKLDNFLLQCQNTFTMWLNTYKSDEYQVITQQLKNQSVTDFFNYLDEMLSHVDQFTNEQLMEWALSGLWLEICANRNFVTQLQAKELGLENTGIPPPHISTIDGNNLPTYSLCWAKFLITDSYREE
ncbi:MAG: hypothetical protein M1815_003131 [Lichina confinis]|nr:MAG: hypothetical protein M1815_003131 [Lichina confinis]